MADTALRLRPEFSTFLLSDQNAGGDGLSYYNYKKLLRSQKVALLQQKRTEARIPGYTYKPTPAQQTISVPYHDTGRQEDQGCPAPTTAEAATQTQQPKVVTIQADFTKTNTTDIIPKEDYHHGMTVHQPVPSLPKAAHRTTLNRAQSARLPSSQSNTDSNGPPLLNSTVQSQTARPKTAGNVSNRLWKLSSPATSRDSYNQKPLETTLQSHQDNTSYEDEQAQLMHQVEHNPDTSNTAPPHPPDAPSFDVSSLVKSFTWTSATKKAYNDVGWDNKLPQAMPAPDINLKKSPPDPVSIRFSIKRHEKHPQQWQCLGGTWDIVQSRPTSGYQRPSDKHTFCSPSQYTRQLPGYQGYTHGESDMVDGPTTTHYTHFISCHQPRPTKISRRPNIPGYTGCTLWSNDNPAHSNMGHPKRTDHLWSYGQHPVDENISPFIRKSVFSKMVSLNAPHNPFNKIEHVH